MADSPRSILVRLEQLKQWQEEQQRVLLEKHLAQQQLLEREQQKMYEVLGLRQHTLDNAGDGGDGEESYAEDDSEPEYEETNLQAQLATERLQQQAASGRDDTTVFDSENEQPTAEQAQALQKTKNVPKKRFLKRGEGLRARFKVDPDKFKLENLPKYKFANHNRERSNRKSEPRQQQSDGVSSLAPKASRASGSKQGKVEVKQPPIEKKLRNKSDQGIVLDINRVQDKKLISTRRMGGSLPAINAEATKQDAHTNEADQLLADRVKRFSVTDMIEKMVEKPPAKLNLPWKKRLLDPAVPPKVSKEQRDLNFFELLEKKVVGKNFSPNSSSILRFIAANESTANEETLTNDESMYESPGTGTALVRQEEAVVKDRLSPPPSRADLKEGDSDESDDDQAHVHFAEDGSKCSAGEDTDVTEHETYHRMQRITSSKMSTPNDKMIACSESHEQTGQASESDEEEEEDEKSRGRTKECAEDDDDDDATVDSANGQSETEDTTVAGVNVDDTLRSEILAKSELLKQRLTELEREIDNYRRENAELIQAKQEHELERLKLQQEREELEEHMNDERIKMEVYFHDERMKIETERKQALREAQKPNKKDREEILRLNEELAEMRKQQKEREAKHSASLARFRAQLKTVEKELQEVRLELEVAKKDNRRLETENTRLKRQNNSRMLVEINRNIAKLAAGGTESAAERQDSKEVNAAAVQDKSKRGLQQNRPKSQQVGESKISKASVQVARAKVISHPPMRGKVTMRTKAVQIQEQQEGLSSATDENNGNRFYAQHDSSDDDSDRPVNGNKSTEDEGDDDDDEDDDEAIGENSSSAQDSSAVQSSYFPKNPAVRKTLFNAVNLNEDTAVPRQGLVRKENPLTQCDLLDRTPEAAEMIKSMKREIVNADGSRDIWYPNGNLKKISADGLIIRMLYFNKDIKETNMTEGTTKYYYFETNTWHTTYLDGLEILEFPDGQTEHRFKDGSTEVHFPNGSIRTTNPNSADIAEEWKYPDGTTVIIRKNDDKEINLPNGQVEIHTKAHKRRIYPDGTVKFVYPDGSQESRYSNGRIRLKDKDGRLISDTGGGP
ncbi:centromere protein J isoform X1 [Anopheles merus]|uniref:centromere protein J isoform X1 n=1 Tax=Anopheles merus TaxID=30066 RepID=UPI001BE41105|nr:centromere protein J isoform X1 [Anopheles merus]